MPSTINLRRKIKSVSNTKQITKAMQMVAASKMRKAQEAALASRAYAEVGLHILAKLKQSLLGLADGISHPLLQEREVKNIVLVVIASDRGLAGGYNSNILRQTLQFLSEHKQQSVQIVTIGRKAQEGLQRAGLELAASFTDFPGRPTTQDILPVAKLTTESFLANQADQVVVIYTKFYSTLKQVAETTVILPATLPATAEEPVAAISYLYEPAPNHVLSYIVPRLVEMRFLQTVLDAVASEHSSRMLAMKNATDNATDLIGDLQLTYNSVRQANITREIAEISAGANSQ